MDEPEKTTAEEKAWLDALAEKLSQPRDADIEFFAKRKAQGLGVGLDAEGNLVYETPPSHNKKRG